MAGSVVSDGGAIYIEGLSDFVRALKEIGNEYPDSVRKANFELAKQLVDLSKASADAQGGVARKASKSLRAGRATTAATVTGGGARAAYFFGAEFGAKKYRRFHTWRGNQWGGWEGGPGYFLHPMIREHARDLIDEYMKQLDELHSKAFPT